jgi:selenocysteine-specific elongation factor
MAWLDDAVSRLGRATAEYLEANPLRIAAPREHVRSATRLDATVFDAIVEYASDVGLIEERGAGLATPGWEARLSPAQQADADRFVQSLRDGRYSPPTEHLPPEDVLSYLAAQGAVENTGRGVVFDPAVYREMVDRVADHLASHGQITIAEVRDLFGTSRKYAQALLEHLDATKVTRRAGDAHVLRAGVEAAR